MERTSSQSVLGGWFLPDSSQLSRRQIPQSWGQRAPHLLCSLFGLKPHALGQGFSDLTDLRAGSLSRGNDIEFPAFICQIQTPPKCPIRSLVPVISSRGAVSYWKIKCLLKLNKSTLVDKTTTLGLFFPLVSLRKWEPDLEPTFRKPRPPRWRWRDWHLVGVKWKSDLSLCPWGGMTPVTPPGSPLRAVTYF